MGRIRNAAVHSFTLSALTLGFLFPGPLLTASADVPASHSDYADAAWVGSNKGALKLSSLDSQPLVSLPNVGEVRALAVNDRTGEVWIASGSTVQSFAPGGAPQVTVSLPAETGATTDQSHLALVVDAVDGSVWCARNKALYRIEPTGLIQTVAVDAPIQGIDLDRTRGELWVAATHSLQVFDLFGKPARNITLKGSGSLQALAFSRSFDLLFAADTDGIYAFDHTGQLRLQRALKGITTLVSDAMGNVWAAADRHLIQIDGATGNLLTDVQPLGNGAGTITALAINPRDDSIWVAGQNTLIRVDRQGLGAPLDLKAMSGSDRTWALGMYADTVPPQLAITRPSDQTWLNNNRPPIQMTYSDDGSGVDVGSLLLTGNQAALPVTCSSDAAGANCIPVTAIPDGPLTIAASIADRAGNRTTTSVQINIDTVPPAQALSGSISVELQNGVAQVDGIAGSVEANASVIVVNTRTGEQVTVAATDDGRFSASIAAQSGDQLSIRVADRAGNLSDPLVRAVGSLSIKILTVRPGARLDSTTAMVTGTYQGPPNTGISVNSQAALVDGRGGFSINGVPVGPSGGQLTASATTIDGETASDTVAITTDMASDVEFTPSEESGLAPLDVTFSYWTKFFGATRIRADFDGDGHDDLDSADPAVALHFTYASPGLYQARLVVTDSNGADHIVQVAVQVTDPAALDQTLRAEWNSLTTALIQGNKQQAIKYLSAPAQERYGPIFDVLLPHMPEIISSFSALQPAHVGETYAEYGLNRVLDGRDTLWFICFIRDEDGVWRVDSM